MASEVKKGMECFDKLGVTKETTWRKIVMLGIIEWKNEIISKV
jgi:hypothetical protein